MNKASFIFGAGLGLLKASAAVSLTSQVVDAAGQEAVAQGLRYASMGLSAAYVGLNVGIGIKDWATSKLSVHNLDGSASALASNDVGFVNGVNTDLNGAIAKANEINALGKGLPINKIAHNPTSGFVADMTESFLQKITFTSSVDRQLANMVRNLNNVTLVGHSQGSLIVGNALVNLGLSDARNSVVNAQFFSTPLSQPRALISAAIGGTRGSVTYANNWGDPINMIGPNINPAKFVSGATFQLQNH